MSKKYGWVIHYENEDVSYDDFDDEPFNSYEEAYEDAEDKCGAGSFGADMLNAYDPEQHPDDSRDIGDREIEVFEID